MENRNGQTPAVPLPNPGEGGAVFPGNESGGTPVVPLPNTGEGGAVFPDGGGITVQPLPNFTITVPTRYAAVRFLNATHGYPPFRIFVDGTRVVNLLDSGTASGYVRIPAGTRTITATGQDGYVYIEQALPFASLSTSTVAIINRAGGLDFAQIADACRLV